jgi:hypothetical protein
VKRGELEPGIVHQLLRSSAVGVVMMSLHSLRSLPKDITYFNFELGSHITIKK